MARVAVLVAHPDDEVLGVGGTILRHVKDGDEVRVHIECMTTLRDQMQRTLDACAVSEAAGGYELTFGDSDQLGYAVPSFDDIDADIYYTHWPHDLNRDHRLVSEAAAVAARGKSLRYFETLSSTEWGTTPFVPNAYSPIDLDAKLALLRLYSSEVRHAPHPRSYAGVVALAHLRGSTVLLPAAEAFHIAREIL